MRQGERSFESWNRPQTLSRSGVSVRVVDLPNNAPTWAAPLAASLIGAGFTEDGESQGGMAGYYLTLRRDDCRVGMGGDRGEFALDLTFPNPKQGRGHPREVSMPAEDYLAGTRGDTTPSFLLSDTAPRLEAVAVWLQQRVAEGAPMLFDASLADKIRVLQNARAKALFG